MTDYEVVTMTVLNTNMKLDSPIFSICIANRKHNIYLEFADNDPEYLKDDFVLKKIIPNLLLKDNEIKDRKELKFLNKTITAIKVNTESCKLEVYNFLYELYRASNKKIKIFIYNASDWLYIINKIFSMDDNGNVIIPDFIEKDPFLIPDAIYLFNKDSKDNIIDLEKILSESKKNINSDQEDILYESIINAFVLNEIIIKMNI